MLAWLAAAALAAESRPFAFGRLLVEDDTLVVGDAGDAYRATLADHARKSGLPVVGAEDLLFGGDRSAEADLLVAASISFACEATGMSKFATGMAPAGSLNGVQLERRCEVTARWQVLDVDADAVAYEVTTRALLTSAEESHLLARDLLEAAADRLFARQGFRDLLAGPGAVAGESEPTWTGPLAVARCGAAIAPLPGGLPDALLAAAVVRAGGRVGSAVVVSPDGWALTAAHVVDGFDTVDVELRSGLSLQAAVVRVDVGQDVAVLDVAGAGHACLPVGTAELPLGAPVFAIGAPAGRDLAFSVSRGIASGYRTTPTGWRLLQTDAAVNPGNSGGPLVSEAGEVVGIVSFKLAGAQLEGLGFGVASAAVLDRLDIAFGPTSSDPTSAGGRRGTGRAAGAVTRVVDPEDPSLLGLSRRDQIVGPPVDGVRQASWTPGERRAFGVLLGASGLAAGGAMASYAAAQDVDTHDAWQAAERVNGVGWAAATALGIAAIGQATHAARTPLPASVADEP